MRQCIDFCFLCLFFESSGRIIDSSWCGNCCGESSIRANERKNSYGCCGSLLPLLLLLQLPLLLLVAAGATAPAAAVAGDGGDGTSGSMRSGCK